MVCLCLWVFICVVEGVGSNEDGDEGVKSKNVAPSMLRARHTESAKKISQIRKTEGAREGGAEGYLDHRERERGGCGIIHRA